MKALKVKWEQSISKTSKIANMMLDSKAKPSLKDIDYNHLQSTSISFEKIPLLKTNKDDKAEFNTAVSSNLSRNVYLKKRNMSTNTGPDVILMLNDLRQSSMGHKRREDKNDINEIYKSVQQKLPLNLDLLKHEINSPVNIEYINSKSELKRNKTKSVNDFAQQIDPENQNSSKKTKSSARYSHANKTKSELTNSV